jgi:hypothetical protein
LAFVGRRATRERVESRVSIGPVEAREQWEGEGVDLWIFADFAEGVEVVV